MPPPSGGRGAYERALPTRIWVPLTAFAMISAGVLGFELQSLATLETPASVHILGGNWYVYGVAPRGLTVYATSCGYDCSMTATPGASITIHLTVQVTPSKQSGCALCVGFNVTAIGVEAPFGPAQFQSVPASTQVPQNSSAEWNLTVQVPNAAGSYPLYGFVSGDSY